MAILLLADDSVTIRRVIELTFADEGVRVVSVGDGEAAIAHLAGETPDLVMADVGMPGVDGYQVATHVKGTPALAHVPVLLLTGAFEPIDEARARGTGCDGVLVKPFEPRQLLTTVRELLAGARPANLWPADMPRVDVRPPTSAAHVAPVAPAPSLPAPVPFEAEVEPPLVPESEESIVTLSLESIQYDADADPELADALARLEFVDVPEGPVAPVVSVAPVADATVPDEPMVPPPVVLQPDVPQARPAAWDLSAIPSPPGASVAPPTASSMSLASVFSALLEAERTHPPLIASTTTGPTLSEAAVEAVVQKVIRRMTDEHVRKIVLETAERLIREEIDRIKT